MKFMMIAIAALSMLILPNCVLFHQAAKQYYQDLQTRASFDLDCPQEDLTIQDLGYNRTMGVKGCGKRSTYVYINGQWLMNSDRQDVAVQAAQDEERNQEQRKAIEEAKKREEEKRKRQE